jgi:hypothetical protein
MLILPPAKPIQRLGNAAYNYVPENYLIAWRLFEKIPIIVASGK